MPENRKAKVSTAYVNYVHSKRAKLFATGRTSMRLNKEVFHYYSHGDRSINTNGELRTQNGKRIWCRQLAHQFPVLSKRQSDSSYAKVYSSQSSMEEEKQAIDLRLNCYDNRGLLANAREYSVFRYVSTGFGRALYKLCNGIGVGESRSFDIITDNHVLSIVVCKKSDTYSVVKFFDPNETLVHQRLAIANIKALKTISLPQLLTESDLKCYFPDSDLAVLADYSGHPTGELLQDQLKFTVDSDLQDNDPYLMMLASTLSLMPTFSTLRRNFFSAVRSNNDVGAIEALRDTTYMGRSLHEYLCYRREFPSAFRLMVSLLELDLDGYTSRHQSCDANPVFRKKTSAGYRMLNDLLNKKFHDVFIEAVLAVIGSDAREKVKCRVLRSRCVHFESLLDQLVSVGPAAVFKQYLDAVLLAADTKLSLGSKCALALSPYSDQRTTNAVSAMLLANKHDHLAVYLDCVQTASEQGLLGDDTEKFVCAPVDIDDLMKRAQPKIIIQYMDAVMSMSDKLVSRNSKIQLLLGDKRLKMLKQTTGSAASDLQAQLIKRYTKVLHIEYIADLELGNNGYGRLFHISDCPRASESKHSSSHQEAKQRVDKKTPQRRGL